MKNLFEINGYGNHNVIEISETFSRVGGWKPASISEIGISTLNELKLSGVSIVNLKLQKPNGGFVFPDITVDELIASSCELDEIETSIDRWSMRAISY